MRIFLPGQNVPSWLEKVTLDKPDSKFGELKFNNVAIVYIRNSSYHVRDLVGGGNLMTLVGSDLTITGQSPEGMNGNVYLNMQPIVSWLEFVLIGVLFAMYNAL